jgi:hypothetical protein
MIHKRRAWYERDRPREFLCSGGGGESGGMQTSKFEPPDYLKGALGQYVQGAADIATRPYEQYTGQRVAEPNAYQQTAGDILTQRAMYGAPDINSARNQVTNTVNDAYLMGNPWLDANINKSAQDMAGAFATGTQANNAALFNRSGAFGGSAHQLTSAANAANLAREVGGMANTARMQNYDSERQRQVQAAAIAGNLSQDDYTAAKNLAGYGDFVMGNQQANLNTMLEDWNNAQKWPYMNWDFLGNQLSRGMGGYGTNTSVTTSSGSPSTLSNLVGGGLAGAAGYSMFKDLG